MMRNIPEPVRELRLYLDSMEPRKVTKPNAKLISLIENAWSDFAGHNKNKMETYKLSRIETVEWDPPVLAFSIERHGGTVLGSTRAEIQMWKMDCEEISVEPCTAGYRRVNPIAKPLNTAAIAAEIANHIIAGDDDPRITWKTKERVRVFLNRVIPDGGPKETTQGRRKRLAKQLAEILKLSGWERVPQNNNQIYEKKPTL